MKSETTVQPSLFDKVASPSASSFQKAIEYLDESLKHGIKPGLERITALLNELDNPQLKYKTILITGTNGKTTTSKMLAAILKSIRNKTGLYISPHLHSCRERINVDGKDISEKLFADYLDEIKPIIEKVNNKTNDPLSNFEIVTALAFYVFAKENVDCVVLEVGMGARFDATCMAKADICVITNVELDHMQYLGATIEKIAEEKSFVIKADSSVILGDLRPEALEVIKRRVKEKNAKIYKINDEFYLKSTQMMIDFSQCIDVQGIFCEYRHLNIRAAGKHIASNATLAIAAAEIFNKQFLMTDKFKSALGKVNFPGRMEIIDVKPLIMADGAHNPAGTRCLIKSLESDFEFESLIVIMAIYEDKDYKAMVEQFLPLTKNIIFSENSGERSTRADKLASEIFAEAKVVASLEQAIEYAKNLAGPKDMICITGSLQTVADVRDIYSVINTL